MEIPQQPSKQPVQISQPTPSTASSLQSSTATLCQQAACTPVDIEWPPSSTSASFGSQSGPDNKQGQTSGGLSDVSFDDIDPFANWPPKPINSSSSIGSVTNSTHNYKISGLNLTGRGSATNMDPIGLSKAYHGSSVSNLHDPSGLDLNSLSTGYSVQGNHSSKNGNLNTGFSMLQSNTNSFTVPQNNGKRATDIGSIFSSTNSGQPPRIAPPPTTAGGRRVKKQGHATSQSSHARVTSEQPPLMDLL